jgi:hypothetical protein
MSDETITSICEEYKLSSEVIVAFKIKEISFKIFLNLHLRLLSWSHLGTSCCCEDYIYSSLILFIYSIITKISLI